jgi:hypothetical protein
MIWIGYKTSLTTFNECGKTDCSIQDLQKMTNGLLEQLSDMSQNNCNALQILAYVEPKLETKYTEP